MESSNSASSFRPLLFTFFFVLLPSLAISRPISNSSILINFTASYLQFADNSGAGAFLASPNNNFQARITNSCPESRSFYFVIVHVPSNTIIWSANRNQPTSQSCQLRLTADGLTLYNHTRNPIWSTPRNPSPVSSMKLLESGNLILLDGTNNTLWESFDFPTDILVLGQKLRLGKSLISSNKEDLSEGSYKLVIGDGDAMLQWNGMNYWKLSMDRNAFRDTNLPVQYLALNETGVYLMGGNGGRNIVMSVAVDDSNGVSFSSSDFRMAKLDDRGVLSVVNYNRVDRTMKQALTGPSDVCRVPYICRRLGVCVNGGSCKCAPGFHFDTQIWTGDCISNDTSLVLPGPCNASSASQVEETSVKYLNLENNFDYFSNEFTDPVIHGANLSSCQSLCSIDCSCLGVFYAPSSESCYIVRNYLGSVLMNSGSYVRSGYVKVIALSSPLVDEEKEKKYFPVIAMMLLPVSGVLLLTIIAVVILMRRRKRRWKRRTNSKLGSRNSSSEGEIEIVPIPGLPVRVAYQELADATNKFKTQIGSGGFGTVYKGSLRDGVEFAVKKIDSLGAEGKREFLSEMATIGKVRHANLVKLEGFCVHRGQMFLIYKYMNRGSLDRVLFQRDPVLGWTERYKIALGAARGLEYLHTGCEQKIIHCDVKPENILLNDKLDVKVSDFGLSKLLNREVSAFFTTIRGTRGYIAPEWLTNTAISDKTDVYSYGMVLLEIIRGTRNFFVEPKMINFPLRALEMHVEGRYLELVDPRLMGRAPSEEVEKLVRVALCCVHRDPGLRPSMCNVVRMLEGGIGLCEPRIDSLIFFRSYSPDEPDENERNQFSLQRQEMSSTSTNSSHVLQSYISSQQVSGPR